MDFLLDTHALLWYYLDDPKLSIKAKTLAADPANKGFVSPATHWEIAIKIASGKYSLTVPFAQFIQEAIYDNGFSILPIEPRHTEQVISLPRHHNDPFDRLLIAQAIVEQMPIASIDTTFDPYAVTRLW
jgi:PIN domain nuclease of toxin-antitoxin system